MGNNFYAAMMIMRNTFISDVKYWQNSIMLAIGSVIFLLARVILWQALYQGQGDVAGRSLQDMMTYTLLTVIISTLTRANMADTMHLKVVNGTISMDLLRPMSTRMIQVSENLGSMLTSALLVMLPTLASGLLFVGGMKPPASPLSLGLFITSLALSILLMYLFESFVVSMTLWYIDPGGVSFVVGFFKNVFGGVIVPLWFLPGWMQTIARCLPFQAAYFVPTEIYLGTVNYSELLIAFGQQVIWIAILYAAGQYLWKKGLARVSILGG